MEKSWVNSVKCLLDRLYKLCLTYLYFFGIYFNVEFFFRILGGRTSLISSNQNLFLSNIIFLFITCFTLQHLQRKVCFSRTINFLLLQQLFLLSNRLFLFENEFLNFLSNNVNGRKSSKKCIKMFEYFRENISNNGIIFYKQLILLRILLTIGEMTSNERSFFYMVQQVLAES